MGKARQPLLLTVRETSQLLRIHRPKVYDLLHEGIIQGFKVGSDWRVKRDSVEKLVGPIPDDFFGSDGTGEQS
jgi:excisionase family DNA binding protein